MVIPFLELSLVGANLRMRLLAPPRCTGGTSGGVSFSVNPVYPANVGDLAGDVGALSMPMCLGGVIIDREERDPSGRDVRTGTGDTFFDPLESSRPSPMGGI